MKPTAWTVGAWFVCAMAQGCKDPSTEALEKCMELEAQGKLDRALAACHAAAKADPSSKAGIDALERIAVLNARTSDEAEAKVAKAYANARLELLTRELADASDDADRARLEGQIAELRARAPGER